MPSNLAKPSKQARDLELANQKYTAGHLRAAETRLRRILRRHPKCAAAKYLLGVIAIEKGQYDAAEDLLRRALLLQPDGLDAYIALSHVLTETWRLDETVAVCHQAIALDPNCSVAHNNLGVALRSLGRLGLASAAFRRAIRLDGDWDVIRVNSGITFLLRGDLVRGFKEWDYYRPEDKALAALAGRPRWNGGDAEGRIILLQYEGGFGDTIQFIRYLPMVVQRCAKVVVQCQPELRRLLAGQWNVECLAPGQRLPRFDLYCWLMSLPLVFGTTLQSIPHDLPYLHAAKNAVQGWGKKLGRAVGLRVGLAWAGSKQDERSMPLSLLGPLASVPGANLYSLQKGPTTAEALQPPPSMKLIDLTDEIHDFADTAALIANLDLVISVDTSVAHLAGAMGKPVWTLLPFSPGWLWMLKRTDSPWYPTMRLFRQPAIGDWSSVINQVAEALRAEANAYSAAKDKGSSGPSSPELFEVARWGWAIGCPCEVKGPSSTRIRSKRASRRVEAH